MLKLEFKYDTSPTSYDNNGSMLEQKITVPTVGSNPGFTATQTYTYDSLNRLYSAAEVVTTQTWKQTFDYDRYGNREFNAANTAMPATLVPSKKNSDPGISGRFQMLLHRHSNSWLR